MNQFRSTFDFSPKFKFFFAFTSKQHILRLSPPPSSRSYFFFSPLPSRWCKLYTTSPSVGSEKIKNKIKKTMVFFSFGVFVWSESLRGLYQHITPHLSLLSLSWGGIYKYNWCGKTKQKNKSRRRRKKGPEKSFGLFLNIENQIHFFKTYPWGSLLGGGGGGGDVLDKNTPSSNQFTKFRKQITKFHSQIFWLQVEQF